MSIQPAAAKKPGLLRRMRHYRNIYLMLLPVIIFYILFHYVPMGGLIVSDKVFQVINAGGDFNHGFTYSGHPVAAAVGLANLRILKEEKILE